MKRRDFLLLRPVPLSRTVDLPCGRVYMRYLEAMAAVGRAPAMEDSTGGEPPLELETHTPEALFAALDEELRSADIVRLRDRSWLAEPAFRRRLDRVLDAFRARGGRVEDDPASE